MLYEICRRYTNEQKIGARDHCARASLGNAMRTMSHSSISACERPPERDVMLRIELGQVVHRTARVQARSARLCTKVTALRCPDRDASRAFKYFRHLRNTRRKERRLRINPKNSFKTRRCWYCGIPACTLGGGYAAINITTLSDTEERATARPRAVVFAELKHGC